jgi:hypothetical protein
MQGVNEEHYMTMRTMEEMRGIVQDSGIDIGEEFEGIFKMAAAADGAEDQCCLVRMG